MEPQDKLKAQHRIRTLLRPKQLDLRILKELNSKQNKLAPMEGEILDKLIGLIDRILITNRTAKSLKALRNQAMEGDPNLEMEDGLLLY